MVLSLSEDLCFGKEGRAGRGGLGLPRTGEERSAPAPALEEARRFARLCDDFWRGMPPRVELSLSHPNPAAAFEGPAPSSAAGLAAEESREREGLAPAPEEGPAPEECRAGRESHPWPGLYSSKSMRLNLCVHAGALPTSAGGLSGFPTCVAALRLWGIRMGRWGWGFGSPKGRDSTVWGEGREGGRGGRTLGADRPTLPREGEEGSERELRRGGE